MASPGPGLKSTRACESRDVRVRVPHREAPEGPKSAPGPGPLVFLGVLGVLVLGAALFFLLR